jgi:hypothetical protein
MEEIICPQCGRPNLIEAEKCWYCQTILEKNTGENQEGASTISTKADDQVEIKTIPGDDKLPDQDIPEWLKRIRELKEADQPPEEKDPNWQQQTFFTSEKKQKKQKNRGKKRSPTKEKTVRRDTKNKKADDQLLKTEEQKRPKQKIDAGGQEKHALKEEYKDSETLSDELPKGFTKL